MDGRENHICLTSPGQSKLVPPAPDMLIRDVTTSADHGSLFRCLRTLARRRSIRLADSPLLYDIRIALSRRGARNTSFQRLSAEERASAKKCGQAPMHGGVLRPPSCPLRDPNKSWFKAPGPLRPVDEWTAGCETAAISISGFAPRARASLVSQTLAPRGGASPLRRSDQIYFGLFGKPAQRSDCKVR